MASAGTGVLFLRWMKARTGGRWPLRAPARNRRPDVNRMPLRLPKVDSATNTGTA